MNACFRSGVVCALFTATLHAQVPTIISYQGRVTSNSSNYHGAGHFKFALLNSAGTRTLWSNDGSSLNGSEPSNPVAVSVDNGLFMVALGDPNRTNMNAIPVHVFTNPAVRLRIWFNDGTNGSAQLTPDQPIHSVGYALMAANLATGAVASVQLADGSVTTPKLADGAVTSEKITSPLQLTHLNVFSAFTDSVSLEMSGLGRHVRGFGPDGLEDFTLDAVGYGLLTLRDQDQNNITAELSATPNFGGQLRLNSAGGSARLVLDGANPNSANDGAFLQMLSSTLSSRVRLYADAPTLGLDNATGGGGLDLHDANNVHRVGLRAFGAALQLNQTDGTQGVLLQGQGVAGGGFIRLRQSTGDSGITLEGGPPGTAVTLWQPGSTIGLRLGAATAAGGGEVSVRNGGGSETIEIIGAETSNTGGQITVRESDGTATIVLDGEFNDADGGARVGLSTGDGTSTIGMQANGGDATLTGGGILRLGPLAGANLVFDGNELLARDNGGTSTLFLNASGGAVAIGTTQPAAGYRLSVNGAVICTELVVQEPGDWPDYVFADDYELMPLEKVEQEIRAHRHLPGVPSAAEVREGGVSLGSMQARLLEKVEELTLYMLDQNRRLKAQAEELAALRAELESVKTSTRPGQ